MPTKRSSSRAEGSFSLAKRLAFLVLLAAWALVLAGLVGYSPGAPPGHIVYPPNDPVLNWCGPFGAHVAYTLFKIAGFGAWILVSFLGLGLLSAAAGATPRHSLLRLIGLALITSAVACTQALLLPGTGPMPDMPGGVIGTVGAAELAVRLGRLGAMIVISMGGFIGALVAMDEWIVAIFGWMWRKTREHGVPAAKVAATTSGELALAASASAAKATARAGGSFFSSLVDSVASLFRTKKP